MYYLKRYLAFQIDVVLSGFLFAPLLVLLTFTNPEFFFIMKSQIFITLTYAIIIISYFIIMDLIAGRSIGKILFKLKIVSINKEKLPKYRILLRDLTRIIDLLFLIPMFFMLLNKNKQSLPDKIMKTLVIGDLEVSSSK